MVDDQHLPLLAGHLACARDDAALRVEALLGPPAAEHECAGIGRIGEKVVDRRITRRRPGDPAGPARPTREQQVVAVQRQHDLPSGPELVKAPEHRGDGLSDRLVRIEHDAVVLVIDKPDRNALAEFALGRLVAQAGSQAVADEVQLGFRHRALQAEHEAIVEVRRVIDAVPVRDQGVGECTEIEELIPVRVVAGETGNLDAEDDADLSETDLRDEVLEALPCTRLRAGTPEVLVDYDDLARRPAEALGLRRELVLALEALGVLAHLGERGLADIDVRVPLEMGGGDLARELARECHRSTASSASSRTTLASIIRASSRTTISWAFCGRVHHRSSGDETQSAMSSLS